MDDEVFKMFQVTHQLMLILKKKKSCKARIKMSTNCLDRTQAEAQRSGSVIENIQEQIFASSPVHAKHKGFNLRQNWAVLLPD